MSSKNRDRETYLKQLPETRKWLNECLICHSIGYKSELPEKIYPGLMAENIRSLFSPLIVNELSICDDCAIHWNEAKLKDDRINTFNHSKISQSEILQSSNPKNPNSDDYEL